MVVSLSESISPKAYEYIAEQVYRFSRIRLGKDKQTLVVGRLSRRVRELGLETFDDYCTLLRSHLGYRELGPLVDLISTNHTRFFREPDHFDFLRDHILPEWSVRLTAVRQPFQAWSAACSSGEEPYTMAIQLAEHAQGLPGFRWLVEATDISTRVLDLAREGIYPEETVTVPHPELLRRHFQRGVGGRSGFLRVKESLRSQVRFHHVNLFDSGMHLPVNQHVIFCRNVMIYFDTASQQELINRLTSKLADGGYLIVGHAESLMGVRHTLRRVKPSIYVKDPVVSP